MTPEAKSYLRGKRYNLEKRQGERTDLTSPENQEKSTTAERLAKHYQVARDTIEKDGASAGGGAAEGDGSPTRHANRSYFVSA
jgi:hypothetical protein